MGAPSNIPMARRGVGGRKPIFQDRQPGTLLTNLDTSSLKLFLPIGLEY
jgi:hypothetical protein